jgi:hypothetical protein
MGLAFYALLLARSCSAATLLVSTAGTFDALPPGTTLPLGAAWSLSFTLSSNPAVSGVNPGESFDPVFSNAVFTENGAPVSFIGQEFLTFRTSGDLGGFVFCINSSACIDGFEFIMPQLYSGPESNPTILAGVFDPARLNVIDNAFVFQQFDFQPVTISALPEPSTLALRGLALLAGFCRMVSCARGLPRKQI